MKRSKKVISICLLVIMLVGLTACSGKQMNALNRDEKHEWY